jgi:ATP adenylyltransferase
VSLERLWAGWRNEFVTSGPGVTPGVAGVEAPEPDCVFCRILTSGEDDTRTHIVWRDPSGLAVALLNAYPYVSGHLMVLPVRHVGDLEELKPAESAVLWPAVVAAAAAVKSAYGPDGLNLGANLGKAAGAGVPGHLHLHVLPRWAGDTNFTTTVAELRVLPEALSVTDAKLRQAWPSS